MKKQESLTLSNPAALMNFSKGLKDFIVKQRLYTPIGGKNYVNIEGWQYAGGNLGLIPVVESCERLERPSNEISYKASVALYNQGNIVGRGIAFCSNKEYKRRNADEYVIASMAQTRAEGKAYRLILGWLMKVAGYEATPSEEMQPENGTGQTYYPKAEDTIKTVPAQAPTPRPTKVDPVTGEVKVPICSICGKEMRISKLGRPYCLHVDARGKVTWGDDVNTATKNNHLDSSQKKFIESLPEPEEEVIQIEDMPY